MLRLMCKYEFENIFMAELGGETSRKKNNKERKMMRNLTLFC